jgi:hypothetical protein
MCVIKKPRERGGHSPRWAAAPEKNKNSRYNAATCFDATAPSSGGSCPVPAKSHTRLNAELVILLKIYVCFVVNIILVVEFISLCFV